MRTRLGVPVITIAAIAAIAAIVVAAAVAGGAVAIRQRPAARPAAAVPLRGDPIESEVELAKLPRGRDPQIAYLAGRVLTGGAGTDLVIPGRQKILTAARYYGSALIVLQKGPAGSELARIDGDDGFQPERIADVRSLVSSPSQDAAAYATVRTVGGSRAKGSTIYWQSGGTDERRTLQRPDDWGATVLAVLGNTVYFAAPTGPGTAKSVLNSWDSASGKVARLKGVVEPAVADYLGKQVVTRDSATSARGCSAVVDLGSGRRVWESCDYRLGGFAFDGKTVFGTARTDADTFEAWRAGALDTRTAALKRRWTGVRFLAGVAEDDDHVLFVADTGTGSRGAIIRCAIGTGGCELATELTKTSQSDLQLLGAR